MKLAFGNREITDLRVNLMQLLLTQMYAVYKYIHALVWFPDITIYVHVQVKKLH